LRNGYSLPALSACQGARRPDIYIDNEELTTNGGCHPCLLRVLLLQEVAHNLRHTEQRGKRHYHHPADIHRAQQAFECVNYGKRKAKKKWWLEHGQPKKKRRTR